MFTIRTALCGLLCFLGAGHLEAALILNGSFENSTAGLPDNWNPVGNMQVISTQGETDGTFALAFSWGNLPSNGSISQTFATVSGLTYKLAFDFGKYSINQPNQVARLVVDVFNGAGFGGTQLLGTTVSDATPATGDPNSTDSSNVYSSFQFSFTAIGSSSTLRFSDTSDPQVSGGGFDAMLDNVSVNQSASVAPEPSTFIIFGTVIASTAGYRAWRRRKRSAVA